MDLPGLGLLDATVERQGMKAPALFAIGLLALSACGKKETRTASQVESSTLRARMAAQQAARDHVRDAAGNYLEAMKDAALARRGVMVRRKLVETSSRLPLGTPEGLDVKDEEQKYAEQAACAIQARDAFDQAIAAYDQAAIPGTPPLPDYRSKLSAYDAELAAGLELMESGREDVVEGWYGLIHKTFEEVTKSES